jgi:dTDP-4-dehydrorhamnose 3,5-epimerase
VIFTPLTLAGAYLVEPERLEDDRGFFARTWCEDEFRRRALSTRLVQCNVSFNHQKGTVRGMHYQVGPHAEVKLVRCTMGAAYDVIIDLRRDSPTYRQWVAVELTAENRRAVYIPEGFAHGFQTLTDATEISYQMSSAYDPASARGIRWDDPAFAVAWPAIDRRVISARDASYELYRCLDR